MQGETNANKRGRNATDVGDIRISRLSCVQWKPNGTTTASTLDATPTEPLCCFWGFLCPVGAPILYRPLLEAERLVVVLDLDETLVQALTLSGFSERIEAINKDIEREEVPAMRLAYEADKRRLESDFAQLQVMSAATPPYATAHSSLQYYGLRPSSNREPYHVPWLRARERAETHWRSWAFEFHVSRAPHCLWVHVIVFLNPTC